MKRSAVLIAGFLGAVIALPAGAFDLSDTATESKLYMNFGFGGGTKGLSALHYGFRMDRAARHPGDITPSLLVADFNAKGFGETYLAGMPVGSMLIKLAQDGEPQAEPAAEGEEAAVPVEDKPWYNPTGWGWVGWTVASVVVVGGGYFLLAGDDESEPAGNGGGNEPPPDEPICVVDPLCLPLAGRARVISVSVNSDVLDAGTGQMGDLLAH